MSVIDNIMTLLKNRNISQVQFAVDFVNKGVKKQTITDWKSGKSNSYYQMIAEIAQYLNVTTDYLLTGAEPFPKELSTDETEWLALYRRLDPTEQLKYRAELKGYIKAKEKTKPN